MLCVYKGNGKKFTDLNLKEIRDEAEKKIELELQLSIRHPVVTIFCLLKLKLENPCNLMLKCNVCIAQCLLVGYYKSSDQSNKVVQFNTEECVGPLKNWIVKNKTNRKRNSKTD